MCWNASPPLNIVAVGAPVNAWLFLAGARWRTLLAGSAHTHTLIQAHIRLDVMHTLASIPQEPFFFGPFPMKIELTTRLQLSFSTELWEVSVCQLVACFCVRYVLWCHAGGTVSAARRHTQEATVNHLHFFGNELNRGPGASQGRVLPPDHILWEQYAPSSYCQEMFNLIQPKSQTTRVNFICTTHNTPSSTSSIDCYNVPGPNFPLLPHPVHSRIPSEKTC